MLRGDCGVDHISVRFLSSGTYVNIVPITTKVVSLISTHIVE